VKPLSVVESERRDQVAVWTLNNPPVNALSWDVIQALEELLREAEQDNQVRAVVITGSGLMFAAGADIQGLTRLGGNLKEYLAKGAELFQRLEASRLPVIAAVNGPALGGGNELAMAADLRIASPRARFGQPEVALGIIPGWGGTVRLPKLVGMAHARRLLLTGESIDAGEAYRMGLIDQIVEPHLLVDAAVNVGDRLASVAPLALKAIKTLLSQEGPDAQHRETVELTHLMNTEDALEGMRAFLEKRRPVFRGR
jgi:enoyl-CoA hydratase/carnithine racemase